MKEYTDQGWPKSWEELVAPFVILFICLLTPFTIILGVLGIVAIVWLYFSKGSIEERRLRKQRENLLLFSKYRISVFERGDELKHKSISEFTRRNDFHTLQNDTKSFLWYDSFNEFIPNEYAGTKYFLTYIPSEKLDGHFWVIVGNGSDKQYGLIDSNYNPISSFKVEVRFHKPGQIIHVIQNIKPELKGNVATVRETMRMIEACAI